MSAMQAVRQIWQRPSFWTLNLVGWSAVAVLLFSRLTLHLELLAALGMTAFQVVLSLIFTMIMRLVYQRLARISAFSIKTAAWLIGVSLVATTIQSSLALVLIAMTGWRNPSWTPQEEWLLRMMFFWLLYMVWSLLYFWIKAEREARALGLRVEEAEAERQRMELQLLRSQLDPHFLFNALNGVATVISSDPAAATAMVRELADYLRYSLHNHHDEVVPLKAEVEALAAYLKIEQGRFGSQLHVNTEITPEAMRCRVPCFLLQPLVENAVKHSFRTSEPPWRLDLRGEVVDHRLHLEIRNTGTLAEERQRKNGVGLSNLDRRLALHYPERHRLDLRQDGVMVCAELFLEGEPCSA